MKRQTRAWRAPEFAAPLAPLQDPHPACIRVAIPTILGMLNTRNPWGIGPRGRHPAIPPSQRQPMPKPGRYWVVPSLDPRPRTSSHRCKHHIGVIQMSHRCRDCIKLPFFLKPGKPPPPRGTTLQPAVRCKAPSPCHGAEPSAHGHVPGRPARPKGGCLVSDGPPKVG